MPWATRLPGGPLKSFFIPPVQHGRDMVELMQRLSLEPTTVTIDRNWDINCWGIGDFYGHEFRGDRDDFQTVYGYAEKDLTGGAAFEVMLIPGLNGWSRMTRRTRDAILRRVRDGAGLVLLHPFRGDVKGHPFKGDESQPDERIWEISPLVDVADDTVNERGYPDVNRDAVARGKWEIAEKHFITDAFPLELIPEGTAGGDFYKYRARGDVLLKSGEHPILAVKNYVKGRVAAFSYPEEGFTPPSIDPFETKIYWNYWEYQYSLLARALLWASGRETPLRVTALFADRNALKLNLSAKDAVGAEIEISHRSEFDESARARRFAREIRRGDQEIEIDLDSLKPEKGWSGGRQIFDVIVRDARTGDSLDWGAASFQNPKRAALTTVRPANDVYRGGETLSSVVRATGELEKLEMRVRLSDDLGRLLAVDRKPARAERTFLQSLADFLGKSALLTAELVDENGVVVDQMRAAPVTVVPSERRRKEYTPLVSFGGAKHYFREAQMSQVRAAAADTGFTWSGTGVDNSLNIPRGSFGVYWYDRGPTTPEGIERAIEEFERTGDFEALGYLTKKELYRRTGDKRFLRREPSFSDPAYMKKLTDIVRATARNKARFQMDYYFVGDEGSLTSYGDPVDFDWTPEALDDFRRWLKTEYKTLSALNREWKTDFRNWEAVVPATTEEARRSGNFAAWADHRTFMEIAFAEAYRRVRDAVTEGDPQAHIALSGTQATNAYNGADWYRLDRIIDDFLSYDGGNQWDLHRSFAKPHAQIGFWTGYGSSGVAVQNAIWTAAINDVLHPNVFWMYSFLNPDLTHSRSARDMGAAFKSLKYDGVGKLLMESERIKDGVAIHYSMPSVHAASILGHHRRDGDDGDGQAKRNGPDGFNFPANRDGWVRAVKDLGLQFDFLAAPQIENNELLSGKYEVLILPFSIALSDRETAAIEEFARRGGTVIADAHAGLMNERCSWRPRPALDRLFGVSSPAPGKIGFQRTAGAATPTGDGSKFGIEARDLTNLRLADSRVRGAGARPLARLGASDAVFFNHFGLGLTAYLNTVFDDYAALRRDKSSPPAQRAVLKAVLERAGVRPAVNVTAGDGATAQTARYRIGETEIFALVLERSPEPGVTGRDGVTVYSDADRRPDSMQELSIKFPRKYFVNDIRTGQSLGFTDRARIPIAAGDALVLGLSPAQNKIVVNGPARMRSGAHAAFEIRSALSGSRLARAELFAPGGARLFVYQKNLLVKNRLATFVFPSALNDPPGDYLLRVTDVGTGAADEKTITLTAEGAR